MNSIIDPVEIPKEKEIPVEHVIKLLVRNQQQVKARGVFFNNLLTKRVISCKYYVANKQEKSC